MENSILKFLSLIILMNHISSLNSELLRAPQQPPLHDYAFTKFRPPPPPPLREPTFIQRFTSWIFPWGMTTEEEELNIPASSKIDSIPAASHQLPSQKPFIPSPSPFMRVNPVQVRDTEPTTARTTRAVTKCSPCNKVPWIPMIPTYQLPIVKGNQQSQQQQQPQQQLYFKHHFGNENPYAQVPANPGYKYSPPTTTTTTSPPSTTPLKLIDNSNGFRGHHVYGIPTPSQTPPFKNIPSYQYSSPSPAFPPVTTNRPNFNTIDTGVITFTTNRPQNNRPSRFTSGGQSGVTNPEYLPPPNVVLPLEGESNPALAPIPIPNLSPTPIPPLFDAIDFHENFYTNQKTGFIKIVPLDPVAQVSNNVNVQVRPDGRFPHNNRNNDEIEVINSNLVAEFTIPPEIIPPNQSYPHQQLQKLQQQSSSRINIDIPNNLDSINTTLNAPIIVESVESVTDNAIAESVQNYHHNIHQPIDVVSLDQLKGVDDVIIPDEANRVFPPREILINRHEEEATTTDGNYIVKFEPSIQTAADLAEEESRKENQSNYNKIRDRETQHELHDSQIFHLNSIGRPLKTTIKPPPPFKPIENYTRTLATLWYSATSSLPITSSTELLTTTTTARPTTTVRSTTAAFTTKTTTPPIPTTLSYLSNLSGGTFSGITLPKEPSQKPILQSTKRPKQIQIVIPYTTYHKPSPFKSQDEQEIITYKPIRGHYVTHPPRVVKDTTTPVIFEPLFNAHGYHNDQAEYNEHHAQESKIVESKVEQPKPTRQLTKVIANNIRDLLKKEKTPKPPKPPKIDIIKLQRNIDGWTEQSFKGKLSTMSIMGHTKSIPSSFLTTTMRATTTMSIPTTTLAPKTTFDPDLMEETRRQYDNILYKRDDETLYVKRHDRFLNRDNELVLINNNLTQNAIHEGVKVYAPKSTLSPKELWKRLHLTVSPLTNEKIYVVTPQPAKEIPIETSTSAYKPRFAIRPTAGGIKTAKKMKSEISRRMDSMDLIDIEMIDGRSNVVKIITPERKEVTNSIDSTTTTEKSSNS